MSGDGRSARARPCGAPDEGAATASIVRQRPAAAREGGVAAGLWPTWARNQLQAAVRIADRTPDDVSVARLLYRKWYSPPVTGEDAERARPLVGLFRSAHAGSSRRIAGGVVSTVERFDLLGPDGWWRTWGRSWVPPRSRRGSIRLMLTPRIDRLPELVAGVTGALVDSPAAWSLGCAASPRRLGRYGGAVLDIASLAALPPGLLGDLAPLLHPVTPPLALPVAVGVGAAEYPDNGMTFGEHRCHLVALALRHPSSAQDPLRCIAAAFNSAGIDPAAPHRAR